MFFIVRLTKNGVLRINFRNPSFYNYRLRCNFKCSYCLQRGIKVKQYAFTKQNFLQTKNIWDKLAKIEDQIFVRVNFQGETLIDKWAKKSAFYINKIPNVKVFEIITNNSINPNTYINELDLAKTSFNCSFHPEFISLKRFLKHISIMKNSGCSVFVNVVCIPQIIKKIPKLYDIFKRQNICLKLQGFLTPSFYYQGRKFPKDYNAQERKILKKFFYSKEEYEYMVDLKRTKGLNCFAGVDMINLFLDSTVKRCFSGNIGNIPYNKVNKRDRILRRVKYKKIKKKIFFASSFFVRKYFLAKYYQYYQKITSINDLISEKIKLKTNSYPCHESTCTCNAHFIGLSEFREKYNLSQKFVDNYVVMK